MGTMRVRVGAMVTVLALVLIVGLSLQPATAHLGTPGHLWTRHLRQKADLRYLQDTRVYVSPQFTLGSLADLTVTRLCPAGWQAIGGGVDFETTNANVQVISDAPIVNGDSLFSAPEGRNPPGEGWRVTMHNNLVLDVNGVVGVVCSK
jgi:hypothetical protein